MNRLFSLPIVLALATIVGSASLLAQNKSVIIERVIVRVNGEILTQSELTQRQIDVLRDKPKPANDAALQLEIDKVTPDVLVESVDDLLLVQRGREMGAKFTDQQFKDAVERIKKENKLDDAGFKTALAQEGMTLDELRQQLERSALKIAVQQREIGPSMTITQEEQRQYYEKHKDQFMTPLMVTLRELFVAIPSTTLNGKEMVNPTDEDAARKKIEDVRARAERGEDFVTLVTQVSESSTKAKGGVIGPLKVDDINPALQDAIAGLQPGGMTQPLKGPKGFQVFKLDSRTTPQLKPLDTVRAQIEGAIRDERLVPETEKMIARLRTQALIEWKDDTYKQIYEKRIAAK